MGNKKRVKWVVFSLIIIIVLLGCILCYLLFSEKGVNENEDKPFVTTTNIKKPEELKNAVIKEFSDVVTGDKYYFATFKLQGDGDIYEATEHVIYNANYVKLEKIPELSTSHIWSKNGNAILSGGKEVTAELRGNKIYSLAREEENECNFVQYEIYVSNGSVVKNVIEKYLDGTVNVSGESC